MELLFWEDEHKRSEPHHHLDASCGPKYAMQQLCKKLPEIVPDGYRLGVDDRRLLFEISDAHGRLQVSMSYTPIGRGLSPCHSIHLHLMQDEFRPIFDRLLRQVFKTATISGIVVRRFAQNSANW